MCVFKKKYEIKLNTKISSTIWIHTYEYVKFRNVLQNDTRDKPIMGVNANIQKQEKTCRGGGVSVFRILVGVTSDLRIFK